MQQLPAKRPPAPIELSTARKPIDLSIQISPELRREVLRSSTRDELFSELSRRNHTPPMDLGEIGKLIGYALLLGGLPLFVMFATSCKGGHYLACQFFGL